MPTVYDALEYMGIDYPDDLVFKNAHRALAAAKRAFYGAVGEDVVDLLPGDERAAEIVLMWTDDLYKQRGSISAKVTGTTRRMTEDMILQLQMDLRRLREGAAKA